MSTVKRARILREKHLSAAEGYLMLEMPEHALAELDAIVDPEKAPFAVNFRRGLVYRHQERYQAALDAFELAQDEDPDHVSLLLAMAWCYKRTDQLQRAISTLEHAYSVAPDEAIVLYNLACYWALAGNKMNSLSWLGRALRMDRDLLKLIPDERDFDPLRDDPDFEMLVSMADEHPSSA